MTLMGSGIPGLRSCCSIGGFKLSMAVRCWYEPATEIFGCKERSIIMTCSLFVMNISIASSENLSKKGVVGHYLYPLKFTFCESKFFLGRNGDFCNGVVVNNDVVKIVADIHTVGY